MDLEIIGFILKEVIIFIIFQAYILWAFRIPRFWNIMPACV